MGLLVKTLELQDFRSFGEKVVGLAPATTIRGPNAAGKTNTVEALQLLTAGYSFRHPTPAQLVREGAQTARVSARLEGTAAAAWTCAAMWSRAAGSSSATESASRPPRSPAP